MNDGFSSGSEGDSSSSSEVDVEPADVSTLQTKNDDVTESDSERALVTPPRTGRMPPSERRHRRLNVTSLEENRTDARQRPLYNLYRGVFERRSYTDSSSFCECPKKPRTTRELQCNCGEENAVLEWRWNAEEKSTACELSPDLRDVKFHVSYSAGTAAVKGSHPLVEDQYYWEVKMTTPVYGTDMMIGVGTHRVEMDSFKSHFCSFLGSNEESWGLSYSGNIHHMSKHKPYTAKFGQGAIIGVHLDMWHGTLEFYKNRTPLGVAYRGLQGKQLYPMVCSTAARSGMRVIESTSFRTSLQFLCCQCLRRLIPKHLDVVDALQLFPPGLRSFFANNLGWLLRSTHDTAGSSTSGQKPTTLSSSFTSEIPEPSCSNAGDQSQTPSTSQTNESENEADHDRFVEKVGEFMNMDDLNDGQSNTDSDDETSSGNTVDSVVLKCLNFTAASEKDSNVTSSDEDSSDQQSRESQGNRKRTMEKSVDADEKRRKL